jgi:signal transduction histidine kinase
VAFVERAAVIRWWGDLPATVRAVAVPVVLGLAGVVQLAFQPDAGHQPADMLAGILVVLSVAPVYWRKRAPAIALTASAAPAMAALAWNYHPTVALLAPMILLYHIGLRGERGRSLLVGATAIVVIVLFAIVIIQNDPLLTAKTAGLTALAAFPLLLGDAAQSRRAYVAELKHRIVEAERTREEEAERRVQAERLHIARDLHDVLAHTIATINVQAGVAAHVIGTQPDHAQPALRAIKDASRDALDELRGLLGVLRSAEGPTDAPLQPAPRLGALDGLVADLRGAGLPVRLEVNGRAPRALTEQLEVGAYRIAQEACTNVVRHAGMVPTRVRITYGPNRVKLIVRNEVSPNRRSGPDVTPNGGGVGIIGMRERAALVGGTLRADYTPDGGFEVVASLPYRNSR